ncbi:T9SS type A sorting domain-containing protein [Aquimarina macrocephali]|uniref:T9SS type A sorting domain-containing protein n=1 Tax=Aquimarina macrocephali TaxID=666563 RepID=UPI001267E037|nr:T9SS type A sorting domain-containing protein [Aquimarina macrocephali]
MNRNLFDFDNRKEIKSMQDIITEINSSRGSSFSVYPNPLKGEVYIDCKTEIPNASCEVFDLKGHLIVGNKNLSIKNTISFTSFPSGMYTIKVRDDNEVVIKKFLKL